MSSARIRALFSHAHRPKLPARVLIVFGAAFIVIANNGALLGALNKRLDLSSLPGATFVFSLYLLLFSILSLVFFVAGHKFTLKPVLLFFIILSAVLGYFSHELGVVFDVDMIRNIVETIRDNNRQEAFELLSFSLFAHVALFGVLPSLFVLYVEPVYKKPIREILSRTRYALVMLAVVGVMIWGNFKFVSFFVRENRAIRVYTIPTYPLYALRKYATTLAESNDVPFHSIGEDAVQKKGSDNRVVGVMVVGETARADHFSLDGYERKTNPLLEKENILNFSHVTSAGTSTAYSVPSMFSFLEPDEYSPERAHKESNVLDVLSRAGVRVVWIENNSSSKGVADRIEFVDLRKDPDPSSPLYSDGGYFDEILVRYVAGCIESTSDDVLIVLHTMGSHGPTYHKRYPESFAKFKPDCHSNSPQECSDEEVINAYDNTILYTDYVLDRLIRFLKEHDANYESFLLYASDHGESLGEGGVYLHGLPDFLAPETQTHIPMFAWLSDDYCSDHHIPPIVSKTDVDTEFSHDNISHTLLGLLDVKTNIYQEDRDLFSEYRQRGSASLGNSGV